MTDEAELIPCSTAHAPVLSELHGACFEDGWDARSMATMLAMPGGFAFLATLDGAPAGFGLFRTAADDAEIIAIGVLEPHRKTGLGAMVLRAGENRARKGGAKRMIIEVAENNAPAREFYSVMGYQRIGLRRGYYRQPDGARTDAFILARGILD